jgi:hypothetical protein
MKFIQCVLLLVSLLISGHVLAVGDVIGSAFSYQGELLDGGSPANGEYSFQIALMLTEVDGPTAVTFRQFSNVQVSNGLFTIREVDFGDVVYDGTEYWLQLLVKKADNPGFHTLISPRQRLSAVPYAVQAEFLAANNANNGDVLQFDGSNWVGQALNLTTAWQDNGALVTTDKYVGIKTVAPSAVLHVDGPFGENDLLRIDNEGSNRFYVNASGRVGIRTDAPNATLHVSGAAADDPMRIQIGSATKFVVKNNGGTSIGVNAFPPDNGLYVQGDVKQNANSNGLLKYMVYAFCSNGTASGGNFAPPASLNRSLNNVDSSAITITNGANEGECVIHFPSNISQRYWSVSITGTEINKGGHCNLNSSTSLRCYGVKLSNGNRDIVNMMVMVY